MCLNFNFQEMISAFIVLFAVIDIIGSIPIIINLKNRGQYVNALKATLISFALMLGFFYAGDMMLRLFHVDIESFAVAGAIVIFLMALEMLLDVEIFKNQGPIKSATLVPLVFPLLAGAGSFTTLLSSLILKSLDHQRYIRHKEFYGNSYKDDSEELADQIDSSPAEEMLHPVGHTHNKIHPYHIES